MSIQNKFYSQYYHVGCVKSAMQNISFANCLSCCDHLPPSIRPSAKPKNQRKNDIHIALRRILTSDFYQWTPQDNPGKIFAKYLTPECYVEKYRRKQKNHWKNVIFNSHESCQYLGDRVWKEKEGTFKNLGLDAAQYNDIAACANSLRRLSGIQCWFFSFYEVNFDDFFPLSGPPLIQKGSPKRNLGTPSVGSQTDP